MIRICGFYNPDIRYIPDDVERISSIEKMTPEMLFMIQRKRGYNIILSMSLDFIRNTIMSTEHFADKFYSFIDDVDAKIRDVCQPNVS